MKKFLCIQALFLVLLGFAFFFYQNKINTTKKQEPKENLHKTTNNNLSIDLQKDFGVINENDVSIYENHGLNNKVLFKLNAGDVVKIIDRKTEYETIDNISGKWYQIQYDTQIGWVFTGSLIEVNKNVADEITNSYFDKKEITLGKYLVIEDPNKKQYIEFIDSKTCRYLYNVGNGFYQRESVYFLRGKFLFIRRLFIILRIDSKRHLTIVEGAPLFTSFNLENGAKLELVNN